MKEILIQSPHINESYDFQQVAQQASGSVLYRHGGTVILSAVSVDENQALQDDFLPLTIQYIEKAYANAKFPSGFIKREGKPSDFETLTSRIIDRTLRPLFPKSYKHPTQIIVMVLSYDGMSDLQVSALHAASSALYVSNIPLQYPVNAVRIGRTREGFCINPDMAMMRESDLDLYVSGCDENILMIEMQSLAKNGDPLSEEELLSAIDLAKGVISSHSKLFREHFQSFAKEGFKLQEESQEDISSYIQDHYLGKLEEMLERMAKSEAQNELYKLSSEIHAQHPQWQFALILSALKDQQKILMRQKVLNDSVRIDGRGFADVRKIEIQTNILPFAHGSCLFRRGQTQALVVATIGSENDAQSYELLGDRSTSKERFMVHYNFPNFSVGEAGMIGAPSRRELGHGNLAKRSLESSIQDRRVVRLVSEILESNGSSSMATVCGGSLALRASGIQTRDLVAGVAMGLIKEGDRYAVLTDIMGLEDHFGDMDFKIAGTMEGVTALQMDLKLGGVDSVILREVVLQAKDARMHVLNVMSQAQRDIVVNTKIVPMLLSFEVLPERIVEVIGQGGKVIKEIIDRYDVSIDLDRTTGEVKVSGFGMQHLESVKDYILNFLQRNKSREIPSYSAGSVFEGRVKKLVDFGAFIELPKGGDGLLHISKIRAKSATLREGEMIRCKILSVEQNKIELDLA